MQKDLYVCPRIRHVPVLGLQREVVRHVRLFRHDLTDQQRLVRESRYSTVCFGYPSLFKLQKAIRNMQKQGTQLEV